MTSSFFSPFSHLIYLKQFLNVFFLFFITGIQIEFYNQFVEKVGSFNNYLKGGFAKLTEKKNHLSIFENLRVKSSDFL